MMETEVTLAEYDVYTQSTGATGLADEGWGRGDRPAINVNWYEAVTYANWLSEQDRLIPVYQIDGESVTWNQNADGVAAAYGGRMGVRRAGRDAKPGVYVRRWRQRRGGGVNSVLQLVYN